MPGNNPIPNDQAYPEGKSATAAAWTHFARSLTFVGAAAALAATAFATDLTISIDTTKTGTNIPANFLGFSFTRQYISGTGSVSQRLFDPNAYIAATGTRTNYDHLVNLIKQLGIKHYRTICSEADATADPSPTNDDDVFFDFCGDAALTSGIYSLHLYGEGDVNVANTSNTTAAQHILNSAFDLQFVEAFAFDNESDWNYRIRKSHNSCPDPDCPDPYITDYTTSCATDPNFTGMSPGFRGKWEKLKSQVSALTNGSAAKFVGPDTGSSWWGTGDAYDTDTSVLPHPGGVPFSLQFAHDESTRITMATQHHYEHSDTNVPDWVTTSSPGYPATYLVGDMVLDPLDTDPKSGIERMYKCIQNNLSSNTHPKAAQSGYWQAMETIWVSGNTYAIGDRVFDDSTNGDGNIYECIIAGQSNNHPSDSSQNPWHWKLADRKDYGFVGSHQLAIYMANPLVLDSAATQDKYHSQATGWKQLWTGALAGASGTPAWPSGLPFRMTEFSPYSGGQNPAAGNFASALWGLEAFHWWARKGCVGVDPHSRPAQTNSPIYQPGGTYADFIAEPYAYAYAAFNLSGAPGSGKALWTSNSSFSVTNSTGYNVSAYGVVTSNASDLYVTIINKTFDYDGFSGSHAVTVKINQPTGFTPNSVRYMALNSGGAAGDSTVLGAKLGGNQIVNTNTTFPQSWTTGTLSNHTFTITVPAFSAMIVDLKP